MPLVLPSPPGQYWLITTKLVAAKVPAMMMLRRSERPPQQPYLAAYFLPVYHKKASQLSPVTIVDMLLPMPCDSKESNLTMTTCHCRPPPPPLWQELFTSPLVLILYELVLPPLWQAGLCLGGPNAEYHAAMEFLVEKMKKKKQVHPETTRNNHHHGSSIVISISKANST